MLTPLLLHLLSFFLLLLCSVGANDDSAVILKLAASLSPTPEGWSSDNLSNYCSWGSSLQCDSSKRVIRIDLSNRNLAGILPSELSSLSRLQYLYLQGNQLTGPVPSLANLNFLQEIHLGNNNFTSIPPGFFQGLTGLLVFSVSENEQLARWSLPSDLAQCTNLTTFEAWQANLTGTLPDDMFASLHNLQSLKLSQNYLSGILPASFANSGIQYLWLNYQDEQFGLEGSIDVLSSMKQLRQVWLQSNQFTGLFPDMSKCKNLYDLQLTDNYLKGFVPMSLASNPALQNVSFSENCLVGPIPNFPSTVMVEYANNYFCVDKIGAPCDPQVSALLSVESALAFPDVFSDSWGGNDACNSGYISCDVRNRVITANFENMNLSGTISIDFANLTGLRNLLLNNNNLSGSIPDSLTKLPELQILDISENNLSGKVPNFASSVKVITTGNPLLRTANSSASTEPGGKASSRKVFPFMAGLSMVIFFTILLLVFRKYNVQKKLKNSEKVKNQWNGLEYCTDEHGGLSEIEGSDHRNVAISIEVLREVTNDFSEGNILGRGGFGVVYRGRLHDGTYIAVKRMDARASAKETNGFQAEIKVLTKVRHRHLVALLGYCTNANEKFLVYEYMPQGTLAQHLFEWREREFPPLTWMQRVVIALDVARGVEYLHSLAQQSFIHRDLKPSNILLGDDMRAKVADFGLVKNVVDGKYSLETRVAGTFGYIAPEYAATGKLTRKVDVYAFGAILMEMITGRKALDETMSAEEWMLMHLVTWFRRVLTNKEDIRNTIDKTLCCDEETFASICKVAELARHCTAPDPYQRPDMDHVVNTLGSLVQQWEPNPVPSHEEEETSSVNIHGSLNPQFLKSSQVDETSSTVYSLLYFDK